jgi:hypothetical protein
MGLASSTPDHERSALRAASSPSPRRQRLVERRRGADHRGTDMSSNDPERDTAPTPPPHLSDDSVVQIHDFIHHVLDLFEARYGDQIHRYYDERYVFTG